MLIFLPLLIVAQSKNLVYFIELARHGARSPSNMMEWDQGRWLDGESILTSDGMRQHYLTGHLLKSRYASILPNEYNISSIDLIASDKERTVRSLMSQMIGLYPSQSWKKSLSENPSVPISLKNNSFVGNGFQIPVFYIKANPENPMVRAKDTCPEYKKYVKERKKSSSANEIFEKYRRIIEKVAKKYGCSYDDAKEITIDIISSVKCNEFAGHSWDPDFDEAFLSQAQDLYMEMKRFSSFSPDFVARFIGNDFLKGLSDILKSVKNHSKPDSGTIFLAHDTTLFSVFAALGTWPKLQPPFGSVLLFEVFLDPPSTFYISMVYNMETIQIPGFNSTLVLVDDFLSFAKTRTFQDSKKACQEIASLEVEPFRQATLSLDDISSYLISSFISLALLLIILALLFTLYKN